MLLPVVFGLGFYAAAGGAVFKSLLATLVGAGLMLGSSTILILPSESRLKHSARARGQRAAAGDPQK